MKYIPWLTAITTEMLFFCAILNAEKYGAFSILVALNVFAGSASLLSIALGAQRMAPPEHNSAQAQPREDV